MPVSGAINVEMLWKARQHEEMLEAGTASRGGGSPGPRVGPIEHLVSDVGDLEVNPQFRNRLRDRRESLVHRILTNSELKLSQLQRPTSIDDILFDLLVEKADQRVSLNKFWATIRRRGLRVSDPRLAECRKKFKEKQNLAGVEQYDFRVDRPTFKECVTPNITLIGKVFKDELVIPEFYNFIPHIEEIYLTCKSNNDGKTASYIPQLARVDPKKWGVSICTIDGQRCSLGDTQVPFCLQSCTKPLTYALALSELGADQVHRYVGQEPSGRSFNELTLDHNNKPHNPMINAGAIVTTSLISRGEHIADRFDYVFKQYSRMCGGEYTGFSNSTYLSERETADRNFALGYYMRENKCFPDGTDLTQTLEFYFQLCSVEVNADSASVMAATLANGGVCPITGDRVLQPEAVRNTLSLMYSCGMYDYSGQFAFKVGLPAKSGVAGAILLVVPKVMGVCIWGPPLDALGNSCRGVQFCKLLIDKFNFHNYDDLCSDESGESYKLDPRRRTQDHRVDSVVNLLFAAANGDCAAIRRYALSGMDMCAADYDGRTALHLAAAEGHLDVVKLLLEQCKVDVKAKDRWGCVPLEDAKKFKHDMVFTYLDRFMKEVDRDNSEESSEEEPTQDVGYEEQACHSSSFIPINGQSEQTSEEQPPSVPPSAPVIPPQVHVNGKSPPTTKKNSYLPKKMPGKASEGPLVIVEDDENKDNEESTSATNNENECTTTNTNKDECTTRV